MIFKRAILNSLSSICHRGAGRGRFCRRCRVLASNPTDWISGFDMSGYTKKYRSEFDELNNAFVFHSRTVFLWGEKQ